MRVETREFAVSLARPLATARGEMTDREGVLVRVTDGDAVGLGEATPLASWTESLGECRSALASAADRLTAGEETPGEVLEDLSNAPAARHGLSLAFADLRAGRRGEPLYRYLGRQSERESVPVNATLGDDPEAETVAAAREAVEAGYGAVKVKVGTRPVAEDVARVRAVRDAVGQGVELRADANGAWDREQATEAFDGFADAGVRFVEQPLPPDDLAGHAALRGGPVGVALDESLASYSVAGVLDADAADLLVLKPMALGGVERARQAALRAREEQVASVVTTTVDAVVARTAAVHLAASIPGVSACGLATADWLSTDVGPDPCPVDDGVVRVPDAPGLGVEGVWE
ncbi:mandelate racemase/muconate lactonizing enzyme family protein [Haloarchaeobius sp. HRN-SO-5]|uniref:mandelate racemase/muconate lactonizing enzyme family protein n=1 Tax=Haloarchaeobius sp. HRN-SO-5 TaxID=3446118 RepID=UPI003EBA78C2